MNSPSGTVLLFFCLLCSTSLPAGTQPYSAGVPLAFEAIAGQSGHYDFAVHQGSNLVLLSSNQLQLMSRDSRFSLTFTKASHVPPVARDPQPGKVSYIRGNDPAKWMTNLSLFSQVEYRNVYRGIDLIYYGSQTGLEFDIVLQRGADLNQLSLAVDGAQASLTPDGDVALVLNDQLFLLKRPNVYQRIAGKDKAVAASFTLSGNELAIAVAHYDRNLPLVVDPILSYGTYLGGSGNEGARAVAVDSSGNAVVVGTTASGDFPHPGKPDCPLCAQYDTDAFITKFNANGTGIIFSMYFGGDDNDTPRALTLDSSGNIILGGTTYSTKLPTTSGVYQASCSLSPYNTCSSGWIAKFSPTGTLLYSTYFGGGYNTETSTASNDEVDGLAADASGNIYVGGNTASTHFPTTPNAPQRVSYLGMPFFAAKFNPTLSTLIYSTYLNSGDANHYGEIDEGGYVKVDKNGALYISGKTYSSTMPTTPGALRSSGVGGEGVLARLNPAGSAFDFITLIGGNDTDSILGMDLDSDGNIYLTGQTKSTDLPLINAIQGPNDWTSTTGDLFAMKINPNATAYVYSTYFGTTGFENGWNVAAAKDGSAMFLGNYDQADCLLLRLGPTGQLIASNSLGLDGTDQCLGVAVDKYGDAYIGGQIYGTAPVTQGAFQTSCNNGVNPCYGYGDAFLAKVIYSPRISLASQSLDFGSTLVTSTTTKSLSLTNSGGGALTATLTTTGDFKAQFGCIMPILENASCPINISFRPLAKGARGGSVVVTSNAPGSPLTIPLSGMGYDISITPSRNSRTTRPTPSITAPNVASKVAATAKPASAKAAAPRKPTRVQTNRSN